MAALRSTLQRNFITVAEDQKPVSRKMVTRNDETAGENVKRALLMPGGEGKALASLQRQINVKRIAEHLHRRFHPGKPTDHHAALRAVIGKFRHVGGLRVGEIRIDFFQMVRQRQPGL